MPTHESGGGPAKLQTKVPCPFLLSSGESPVTIQGRAQWISDDQAYVLVPYGTARSLRQCWDATAWVPDRDAPGQSQEIQVRAQLVSAEATHGLESETEGLLLRLTRIDEGRRFKLVDSLRSS